MKSVERLTKLAERFSRKMSLAQGYGQSQEDIGTGEPKAVAVAAGRQIKTITDAKGISDKVGYIEFQATVTAPNFVVKGVNLDSVEVYVGFDEPAATKAKEAAEQVMALKGVIEAALTKFYKTPEGISILKSSGTPPTLKVVFKWKWS